MPAKSRTYEHNILDRTCGLTTFTPPGTLYFALFTVAPTETTSGTEYTGNAYARAAITNDKATGWNNASGGSVTNKQVVAFPTVTTANWTGIVAWALMDAATVGTIYYFGSFGATQSVAVGQTAQWNNGGVTITES